MGRPAKDPMRRLRITIEITTSAADADFARIEAVAFYDGTWRRVLSGKVLTEPAIAPVPKRGR